MSHGSKSVMDSRATINVRDIIYLYFRGTIHTYTLFFRHPSFLGLTRDRDIVAAVTTFSLFILICDSSWDSPGVKQGMVYPKSSYQVEALQLLLVLFV